MRLQHSNLLVSLLTCLLLLLIASQSSLSKHRFCSATQDQANAIPQTEAEVYKTWYDAFSQGDISRATNLATQYIKLYPNGKYVAYLQKWIERSLEPARRSEARQHAAQERQQVAEKNGLTILLEETSSEKNRVLESLLQDLTDEQTDANIRIAGGKTALMLAAANGNVKTVRALIHKQADITAKEYTHGWTALVYAIWSRDLETVQTLLDNGADVKIRDKENRTPLEHARISGDADIIRLLETVTAK
jgi:hypothetical protein